MGGGDLNLKKSWHPSTLRNIERVWKAEQKHEAEQQKIEQLQKELAEERAREEIQTYAEDQGVVKKKEEKLDWMYQGPAAMVNRDEYLLGRKIDKTFETLQQMESGKVPEEDTNDVTVFSSQNLSGNVTVDLANKIREDPLFNIMKKEKEQRKNLLTNPVKMKQLQQMLKASLAEKAHKKSKKSKKKKKDREIISEDESPEKRKKHKKHNYSDSEEEVSPRNSKKASKIKYYQNLSDEHGSRYNTTHSPSRRQHSSNFSYNSYESSSKSSHRDSHSYNFHKDYISRNNHYDDDVFRRSNKDYNEHYNDRHSVYQRTEKRSADKTNKQSKHKPWKDSGYQDSKSSNSSSKKKMDSSERDRLLKEMQENAKWREEQRKRNTTRYREEDEREDKVKKVDSSDFLKPMLSKAAGKGSLENRVKQKIFSIQRSSSAMDKNFARRD